MKKILAIILVTIMLLALTACNTPGSTDNGSDHPGENNGSENGNTPGGNENGNENGGGDSGPSDNNGRISADMIRTAYGSYIEGVVFVSLKNDDSRIHCINKSGEILFSVAASSAGSFSNGLAIIYSGSNTMICDKTGKITTAEDLGGDKIVAYDFAADYILVERSSTSYLGTVYELATFNTKFEKIVDFSSEFHSIYQEIHYGWPSRIDRYILKEYEDTYLDLHTGTIMEGKSPLAENIKAEKLKTGRASDYWDHEGFPGSVGGFYIYDVLDFMLYGERTVIFDLNNDEKYSNIDTLGNFSDGVAPVIFKVQGADNSLLYYYTLMDEEGNFKFEPVQISGPINSHSFGNGYFACDVSVNGYWNSSKDRRIEVYDMNGNRIAQKDYTVSTIGDHTSIAVSEGTIYLDINGEDLLCDTELNPLF